MSYHKASVTSRLGFHVRFPVQRGRSLVYNPESSSEEDNYCLLKCLAAFAIKLNRNKTGDKNFRWDNIPRMLKKTENIKKYLRINNLQQNQFTDIRLLEVLNKFCINV